MGNRMHALSAQLRAYTLDRFARQVIELEVAVEWLRVASQLHLLADASGLEPRSTTSAAAAHALCLEHLKTKSQFDRPAATSLREYRELLVDYEIVSCQDQPESDSPLAPAERRWHAAAVLADRLCEAGYAAAIERRVGVEELVGCWERRRDARLAAASLTGDDAARRGIWQQFADAVHSVDDDSKLQSAFREQGTNSSDPLLTVCWAMAKSALSELDHDSAGSLQALQAAVSGGERLLQGVAPDPMGCWGPTGTEFAAAVQHWADVRRLALRHAPSSLNSSNSKGQSDGSTTFAVNPFADACWKTYLAAQRQLAELNLASRTTPVSPAVP